MNFFSCCYSTPTLSAECLLQIDKALGNIKNSHKAIAFIGVVQLQGQKANMLQYQYNHLAGLNSSQKAQSNQTQNQSISQIKEKVEKVLEKVISFKIAQRKIAREMGFDSSKEVYIKGDQSVVIIYDIASSQHGGTYGNGFGYNNGQQNQGNNDAASHLLVIFLEMNALKVEFFDCETFITTIDDLIVNLIEALNYDNSMDSQNDQGHEDNRRDRNH